MGCNQSKATTVKNTPAAQQREPSPEKAAATVEVVEAVVVAAPATPEKQTTTESPVVEESPVVPMVATAEEPAVAEEPTPAVAAAATPSKSRRRRNKKAAKAAAEEKPAAKETFSYDKENASPARSAMKRTALGDSAAHQNVAAPAEGVKVGLAASPTVNRLAQPKTVSFDNKSTKATTKATKAKGGKKAKVTGAREDMQKQMIAAFQRELTHANHLQMHLDTR